jgi:hypothetical protein
MESAVSSKVGFANGADGGRAGSCSRRFKAVLRR